MMLRDPLRLAALAAVLALVGCAAPAPVLTATSKLDATQGVVFGRMIVERDGQKVTADVHKNLLKPSVTLHISPFGGVQTVNNNTWVAGKWRLTADLTKGGNFSIVLPAGKYYIVEFQYFDMYPAGGLMLASRSYVSGDGLWTTRERSLFTFDVQPGQSIYVGSLLTRLQNFGSSIAWDTTPIDEEPSVTEWFRAQFPAAQPASALLMKKERLD